MLYIITLSHLTLHNVTVLPMDMVPLIDFKIFSSLILHIFIYIGLEYENMNIAQQILHGVNFSNISNIEYKKAPRAT